mmetsp:Transcript_85086/g.194026  ORF Transcript_85086/g.194026 Transcript_85086/m.194026 type:complete len:342 (+) Transcript_85086:503-1528(+)
MSHHSRPQHHASLAMLHRPPGLREIHVLPVTEGLVNLLDVAPLQGLTDKRFEPFRGGLGGRLQLLIFRLPEDTGAAAAGEGGHQGIPDQQGHQRGLQGHAYDLFRFSIGHHVARRVLLPLLQEQHHVHHRLQSSLICRLRSEGPHCFSPWGGWGQLVAVMVMLVVLEFSEAEILLNSGQHDLIETPMKIHSKHSCRHPGPAPRLRLPLGNVDLIRSRMVQTEHPKLHQGDHGLLRGDHVLVAREHHSVRLCFIPHDGGPSAREVLAGGVPVDSRDVLPDVHFCRDHVASHFQQTDDASRTGRGAALEQNLLHILQRLNNRSVRISAPDLQQHLRGGIHPLL